MSEWTGFGGGMVFCAFAHYLVVPVERESSRVAHVMIRVRADEPELKRRPWGE